MCHYLKSVFPLLDQKLYFTLLASLELYMVAQWKLFSYNFIFFIRFIICTYNTHQSQYK